MKSRFLDEAESFFKEISVKNLNTTNTAPIEMGKVGNTVTHEKYGKGTIEEISGNEITIDFGKEWGVKYLDIEWAPIKFD